MSEQDRASDHAARLAKIKRQIQAETYETSYKLSAALEAFCRDAANGDLRPGKDRPRARPK